MRLLQTIFYIILFYYVFKLLARIFAPYLLKFAVKKAQERFSGNESYKQQQESKTKEGEVSIDKMPLRHKPSNKDVGDYVDYEEID